MKTIFFLSAADGVLGEVALLRRFARAAARDEKYCVVLPDRLREEHDSANEAAPVWKFIFESAAKNIDNVDDDTAAVLCVVPTVHGLAWAQRQKNELVIKGIPEIRMAALVLFTSEDDVLPSTVIDQTLGFDAIGVPITFAQLFRAHNDPGSARFLFDVLRKPAARVRVRLESGFLPASAVDVPWRAVEKEILESLWNGRSAEESWSSLANTEVERRIHQHTAAALSRHGLSTADVALVRELERRLIDHVTGLGPLAELLRDPDVNEIMINGIGALFVEKNGEMLRVPPAFDHETHLRTLIERIVAPSGRRVDWAAPFCDVRLPDGSRVNIVLPPLSLDGPCVTIRRFRPGFASMEDLERVGTVDATQARQLARAVEERRNIVIAGNTGAGKTTLLNVLASFIPDRERILTLEDAAELAVRKPHVVRLETRPSNTEGKGQIMMRELVVNALRMRPDRLLVGECRGDEVIPMLQAMNTGHDGSMTTLHANSAEEVGPRLEALVSMAAPQWPLELIRQQIRSAFDAVIYMRRDGPRRRVMEIRDVV